MILQRLDDLRVAELEQAGALLDDGHLRPERGEHRGVLDADHARPDHDHRAGDLLEIEDLIRVENRLAVEPDVRRVARRRPDRDHDRAGLQPTLNLSDLGNCNLGRADEGREAAHELDTVPSQLVLDDVDLGLHDVLRPPQQVVHRELGLESVALSVHRPLAVPREIHDRLAERLRRDGPRVHAHATEAPPLFDQSDALSELCRLDCRALTGRAGADHDEVVQVRHQDSLDGSARVCRDWRQLASSAYPGGIRPGDRPIEPG